MSYNTDKMIKITNQQKNGDTLTFQIQNCNVSIINAIRRTVLSDIDTVVIRTTPYEKNDAEFIINTTRTHNEMLKHRLSCIPIHIKDTSMDLDDYIVECHEINNTDTIKIITTEHFKIKNVKTGNYLTSSQVKEIFPPDNFTKDYIIFTKLRPKINDISKGEEIYFKAKMSVSNASVDSTFNVVSTCSYSFTTDKINQDKTWNSVEKSFKDKGYSDEEIINEKQNWYLSEGKRIYLKDTFDFIIKTLGVFESKDILEKACNIIINNLNSIISKATDNSIEIKNSTTMINSYDIILNNIDYTIGKIIEYAIYNNYFGEDKSFNFVGFNKEHPHDKFSIIRVSFNDKTTDKNNIYPIITNSCNYLIELIQKFKSQL